MTRRRRADGRSARDGRAAPPPRFERPEGPPPRDDGDEAAWLVGRKAVAEALEAAARTGSESAVDRVLLSLEDGPSRWWAGSGLADAARTAGATLHRVPRQALESLAPGVAHQGVAARLASARIEELDDLLPRVPAPALLVLADGIEDPRNLGALLRSAAAAGAGGVVLPERRSAGLTPAAAKAAAGALGRIPVARCKNVQRALETMAHAGIWSVGLDPAGGRWDAVDLARPTCLVVGGEGRGLSRLARERCDVLAGLPLARGMESLNAAVAAGIVLYEAVRQRRPGSVAGRELTLSGAHRPSSDDSRGPRTSDGQPLAKPGGPEVD